MKLIKDTEFGGERPLFASRDLRLENVIIREGESAIKECSNIEAFDCRFEGNYPFWHVHGFRIERCYFDIGGRSALWYSDHLRMRDTVIDAPKMFREMSVLDLENLYSLSFSAHVFYTAPLSCFLASDGMKRQLGNNSLSESSRTSQDNMDAQILQTQRL